MPVISSRVEAEKEELNWLLTSGAIGRSSNLTRMLTYVCEKHFLGQDEQVKEYTIATEALGRREDFDPQSDTIVRVTAHSLRKRLEEIYQTDGVNRPVHILIPLGRYVPSFVHLERNRGPGFDDPPASTSSESEQALRSGEISIAKAAPKALLRWSVLTAFIAVVFVGYGLLFFAHRSAKKVIVTAPQAPPLPSLQPAGIIRTLMGTSRRTYVDQSGSTWTPSRYCSDGDSVTVPTQKIVGTEDPSIYMGGIRGIAHCTFPVKPGQYEIHLYFAETSDLQAATRPVILSVNAGPDIHFDVVDNAGGDGIATSEVLSGIRPENDGAIHLDFTSEVSLLDAIEILPENSENLLPVRITASPFAVIDSSNQVWVSDRYFIGGRRGQRLDPSQTSKHDITGYARIGSFRYNIPVVSPGKYRVTLFFSEPWFGKHDLVRGGPGSRIFNVSCNGSMILKNFDIMAEGGANPAVKRFENIEPTARGRIELSFTPVVNYPIVNAIEVVSERSR
jgi:hypothetical protein